MATSAASLPDLFDFGEGLYRGDTYVWTHYLNDDPLPWEPSTAYTVGDTTHAAGELYVAGTTVTHEGLSYTCTTAHTSEQDFDATKWTLDPEALGPETDISAYVFEGQYRTDLAVTAAVLAEETFALVTDGSDGAFRRTLPADQSALLIPTQKTQKVNWDLQATLPDSTVKTLLRGAPKVTGDSSR